MSTRKQDLQLAESIAQTACLACEHAVTINPDLNNETAKTCFRLFITSRILDSIPDLASYLSSRSPKELAQIMKNLTGLAQKLLE